VRRIIPAGALQLRSDELSAGVRFCIHSQSLAIEAISCLDFLDPRAFDRPDGMWLRGAAAVLAGGGTYIRM
jgi:hypothetical protein